jgi:hypothetical protein
MVANDFHDEMQEATGMIVAELERAGFDPCPAIDIANRAMKKAWGVWSGQAEIIDRLVRVPRIYCGCGYGCSRCEADSLWDGAVRRLLTGAAQPGR